MTCLAGSSPGEACPAQSRQVAAAVDPLLPPDETLRSPLDGPVAVKGTGAPEDVGQWLPAVPWPVIAIHAALMPTGEVLHYSYPDATPGSRAYLWSPEGGFNPVNMNQDIFCSGHSLLPDGSLYATGGNDYSCEFQGRVDTHIFNPFTETWTRLGDMSVARWYPSNTALGDGRVMITSGLGADCNLVDEMEFYTPGVGLELVPEGARHLDLYPRLHLLASGRVAHVGPENESFTFDPQTRQWQYVDDAIFGYRADGTSVEVPGEADNIMLIGGGVTASCERIDFTDPQPEWRTTGSMSFARSHLNAVILPDRKVLVVGGGTDDLYGDPVLNAELYDPATEAWTLLPAQAYPRMYHSTAVLLPDGRVLSAGQDDGPSAYQSEIYEPAYLFRGPRPVIAAAPGRIGYAATFEVTTPAADDIASVALIAPTSVTHSINKGQRYVGLSFTQSDASTLAVTGPSSSNRAPPGYYMLFILNSQGVPSVARMVRVVFDSIFADGFESGDTSAW
ncbi:MAG: galactose oxidase-like domain-containing protein [Thermoanaerobaculia bacterium]